MSSRKETISPVPVSRSRRTSFEAKLVFLTIAVLLAALVPLLYLQLTMQKSDAAIKRLEQFQSIARTAILSIDNSTAIRNPQKLASVARHIQEEVPEFHHMVIEDNRGRVLFDSDKTGTSSQKGKYSGNFAFSEPISENGQRIGMVRVDFTVPNISYTTEDFRSLTLAIFAVATILAVLLATCLARSISRPIRALIHCAQEATAGNLDVSVPINPYDEFGELCSSFNAMIVSLREAQERLVQRINHDTLTDLYNHRYFQERLSQEIRRAERTGKPLTVLMIDVDHFKRFNDSHGHPRGDSAIKAIAKIIERSIRSIDLAARYGGEEFAVILADTDIEMAAVAAERIRSSVEETHFQGAGGAQCRLSVSIGTASFPEHSKERDGLIIAADLAMYRAKHTGRNRICSFESICEAPQATEPHKLYMLLDEANLNTIEALGAAVDAKDPHTHGHSLAVARYAVGLAMKLGLSQVEQDNVRIASLLHDIGKIGIPDKVLNKPGYLTIEERKLVESHPCLGDAIIRKVPRLAPIFPGVLYHHERYDGNGYPARLQQDEIPLVARIISIVDTYDAITSDRPYRKRFSNEEARAMIQEEAGSHFDPELVGKFLEMLEEWDNAQKSRAA